MLDYFGSICAYSYIKLRTQISPQNENFSENLQKHLFLPVRYYRFYNSVISFNIGYRNIISIII